MTEGDCSHDSQAVAWALGTLSAEETERFAAHLATCETCAPLVARIREVVDVLPDSVQQEVPPAELRARIMSAVEAEANLFRAADEVGPWPEPARARKRTPGALVGVVVVLSLLAVGVLVGSALTSNKRNGEPRTAVRTTTGSVTDAGGGPRARAAVIERDKTSQLVLTDIAPPPQGRVYQAWVIRHESAPTPTGALFSIPQTGDTKVSLPSLTDVERVIVTAAPPRGSPAPTPPPLVVVLLGR